MKTCNKCGSTNRYKVNRTNSKTGEKYETSICADCRLSYQKKSGLNLKWQQANRDHLREYQKDYYSKENRYSQRNAKGTKLYKKRLLGEIKPIIEFYKNTPPGHEVDHIVPLNGKNVSGLHTMNNLQYLPTSVNRSKSNKF